MEPCSQLGVGTLAESHGVSCVSTSRNQAWLLPGAEGISSSMSSYSGGSGCRALFFMQRVVATLGSPASLSGFPLPPWAETNSGRWHDLHALRLLWV